MNTSINVSYYDYINYNSDYYNKIVIIKHVTVVWILGYREKYDTETELLIHSNSIVLVKIHFDCLEVAVDTNDKKKKSAKWRSVFLHK